MKCVIRIDMDIVAFEDCAELPAILRNLARGIEWDTPLGDTAIRDINGNIVGKMEVTE